MNNGLTKVEEALNCIIENYINELQRNTCDDNEEDMRIYKEKIELIKSQKEIVLKDLEILEILREGFVREGRIITYKGFNQKNWDKVEEWLENGK